MIHLTIYSNFKQVMSEILAEAVRANEITQNEMDVTTRVMEVIANESTMNAIDSAILRDSLDADNS